MNHLLVLDLNSSKTQVSMKWDSLAGAFVAESPNVDDSAVLTQFSPEYTNASMLGYIFAMKALMAGDLKTSDELYAQWRPYHKEDKEIDDYHFHKAHKIAETEGVIPALTFVNEHEKTETRLNRKAHFHYLAGEIADHHGESVLARQYYRETLQAYPDVDEGYASQPNAYALMGLGMSLLFDQNDDSSRVGENVMASIAENQPKEKLKKQSMRALISRGLSRGDMDAIRPWYNKLAKMHKETPNVDTSVRFVPVFSEIVCQSFRFDLCQCVGG